MTAKIELKILSAGLIKNAKNDIKTAILALFSETDSPLGPEHSSY
jgi:hypothetical protein